LLVNPTYRRFEYATAAGAGNVQTDSSLVLPSDNQLDSGADHPLTVSPGRFWVLTAMSGRNGKTGTGTLNMSVRNNADDQVPIHLLREVSLMAKQVASWPPAFDEFGHSGSTPLILTEGNFLRAQLAAGSTGPLTGLIEYWEYFGASPGTSRILDPRMLVALNEPVSRRDVGK